METQLGAFCDTIFGSIDFCRIMVYDEEKCIVWEGLKVDFLKNINLFFEKYGVTIEGIEALIGIITVVGAAIFGFVRRKKNRKRRAGKREEKAKIIIKNSELENSQVAETINNYGLSHSEVKEVARDVVAQETLNKPNVYIQKEEPVDAKLGDIWYKIEE